MKDNEETMDLIIEVNGLIDESEYDETLDAFNEKE